MLVAVGKFSIAQLLEDFQLMALNRNERHELNRKNSKFVHGDGWGIVTGKSGKLECYKKDVACWKDLKFHSYCNADMDFVVLHARRASSGLVNYNFTHPFERNGWYFCHNGTICDFKSKERSDSEQFFSLILDNLQRHSDAEEAIKNAVNQVKAYTALNFILANDNKTYILVKHRERPEYYTMKYLKNENCVIVSSEVLPNFKGDWRKICNNTIFDLDIINCQIHFFNVT